MNKFLYNGKELQEQSGYYDYGFRQLDPQLGRWHVVDAMAESYYSQSPYNYVGNNPVSLRDYMGLVYSNKLIMWENNLNDFLKASSASGGRGGSLADAIAQADAEDAAWHTYMDNATYVPGAGYVNSNDVISLMRGGQVTAAGTGFINGGFGHYESTLDSYGYKISQYAYTGHVLKNWFKSNFYSKDVWVWDNAQTGYNNPAAINIYTENNMSDPFAKLLIPGNKNYSVTISGNFDDFSNRNIAVGGENPYVIDLRPAAKYIANSVSSNPRIISANISVAAGMGKTIGFDVVVLPTVKGISMGLFLTEGTTYGGHADVGISLAEVSGGNLSLDDFGGWSERVQLNYWDKGGGFIWGSKYSAAYSGPGVGWGASYAKIYSSLIQQFKFSLW